MANATRPEKNNVRFFQSMEAQIEALQRDFPSLDRMMCETLLKLHEQGKLAKYAEELEERKKENVAQEL
jgi:hypothetical protein